MINYIPVDFDPFAGVREIEKITFTNEPQREIWLSCIIGGNDANLSYNESVSLKLNGTLNFAAFKTAVDNLVLRHEALRATVSPNGETLIIYKDFPVTLELQDITGRDEQATKNEFSAFLQKEMNTALDLVDGPLFKVFLHKTSEQEHYFTVIKHHVIGDGWSTGIMLEDLSRMYNAYSKGAEISLERASQISDYASAQLNFKLTRAYKETEDYWLNIYKDNVPVVDVPTDHPRFAPRSYKGNRLDYPITKEMADQLKAVGAKQGCGLVTTLLAAFEVFLYQQTHQEDLVVGLPASGQAATGLTNVIGHCVNLLPLKTHVDPALPFSGYLKIRKKEVLDAYDHQRLTFGELLKKLYIQRDPSRIPLVPVIFNIDMGMDNAVSFDGLSYKLISNPRSFENFEIYLNATGSKEGIILEWSYNTDLFEEASIAAFNNSYDAILRQIISEPARTIADLAGDDGSVSVAEGAVVTIAADRNIVSLIEAAAGKYSKNSAAIFQNSSLSYAQLAEKTDQLASLLIEYGIGAGDIVAISLDRSMEMLICLLSVLKAGAAYTPLDPEYPFERVKFMLEDSKAKLFITSTAYKGRYNSTARELIVEDVWPKLNGQKKLERGRPIQWTDLTYLLYTSGSTGKPKGVRITHKNMANLLVSMRQAPGITETDRLLALTSISFDIACVELYLPLISGACVIIADSETTKDGRLIISSVEQKNISILQGTPSTWQMLIDSGWEKRYPLKMFTGGEQLPRELATKLLERGKELWNMYAPTETTVYSIIKKIELPVKQVTIGKPINNTHIVIMDADGAPALPGREGEIYIGGDGVADGYWNRPELTGERFVSDPTSDKPGAKLYRTGDLGKLLSNGEILCLGRIDLQVKIRGHRIELGEIETVLQQQNEVRQAVVIAREDIPGDKRLIGYVTLKEQQEHSDNASWKDRWDTLYETGAKNKENESSGTANIDGTLLESLENSAELKRQGEEWLSTSVSRIKELGARRIYEIGSGAGQILFELAPGIDYYMATDYAPAAITNIQDRVKAEPLKWKHVRAAVAGADDFSAIGDKPLDLVLINSVAQYFPDTDYMINVIRKAVAKLGNGGCLFIGDMQGKNSLEMYHAMDYLPRASAESSLRTFKDVVANRVRIEEEFVADPAFFYLLPKLIPAITGVDVQLRQGQSLNETTKYHYDIWLYVNKPVSIVRPQVTIDWKEVQTVAGLETLLNKNSSNAVEVSNISNVRTARDHRLLELLHTADPGEKLATIKQSLEQVSNGMHPDLFWECGAKLKYDAHIRWTTDGSDGLFDAVFIPASATLQIPAFAATEELEKDIYNFARTPIISNEVLVPREVINEWRKNLDEALPAYMVPEDIIVLQKLPMTPNAKIDRKALPKPKPKKAQDKANERTVLTKNEQIITDIWSEVLGLQDLHPSDDFFQLGGHSLLAVKVMVAIEKKTGKRLPIATLFNNSTIEKLATQIAEEKTEYKWEAVVPIKTTGKKTPVFLIHGAGMNVLLFKSISEYFDPEQPVYGIQALGLYHKTDIPTTIEAIAARYVKEILQVAPTGAVALAGYSMGGFIAYEIARQLKKLGKEINFVGVMDTYVGNNQQIDKSTYIINKIRRQFQKVPFYTKSFLENPTDALNYQVIVAQKRIRKLKDPGIIIPQDTFTPYEEEILKTYDNALNNYVMVPLDVSVTLFRVQKRLYFLDDLITLGWDKFALKGVKVHEVPGDHKTFLFSPNAEQFARIMQKALDSETGKK